MRKLLKSFGYAINGFLAVLRTEANMKIHFVSAVGVILTGFFLNLESIEWAVILLCIVLVLGAEIGNTIVEKYLDAYHPERNEIIGGLKDMAAAAVLIIAIFSAFIGLIIFIPKIIDLL